MKSLLIVTMFICGIAAKAFAQTPISLPVVTGPIPVSEQSWPLMASNRIQEVVDIAAMGYVEEEFFISGTANLYDWATDGTISIKTVAAPYTTRLLIRRPAAPAQFSGNVIVEPLNEARGYDWAFIWALSHRYFMEHGDAYVGITHMPQNIESLQKFDPVRYATMSFANPNPTETCGPQNTTATTEEGLHWDIFSQVGALLKSKAAIGPLAGFNVQYLFMSAHHGQAVTYAATIHKDANLANGAPIYDGYLLPSWDVPTRMRRCGTAPAAGDVRQIVSKVNVPIIRVVPQGEVLGSLATRRDDSDAVDDRYRLYEVAGAPRMDRIYFQHLPMVEDQIKAGQPASVGKWPYNYQCTPNIDLLDFPIKRYVVDGAFANLDRWVRTGTAPPRAQRLAVMNVGTPQATFETDEYGNARGGVRHVYVTVPAATYAGNSPGQCGSIAMKKPFDWARLQAIYGSPQNYAQKVAAALNNQVSEGWITGTDAALINTELLTTALGAGE